MRVVLFAELRGAEARDKREQEHPGICVCGGSLTDEALA